MKLDLKRIKLTEKELAVLLDYGTRKYKHPGGFQYLVKAIFARLNQETGELDLSDNALLGRAVHHAVSYGPGGFQDTFLRPLLRRTLII